MFVAVGLMAGALAAPDAATAGRAARCAGSRKRGPFCPQPATLRRPADKREPTTIAMVSPKLRAGIEDIGTATLDSLFCMGSILLIMSTTLVPTPLSDGDYRSIADALLAHVETTIDRWLQDDVVDIDTSRTGGLLELSFPDGSKIILNTQPPLQELWMAARSGGYHYKYVSGQWLDTRDGSELLLALSRCATTQAGCSLTFDPVPAA
jgi:CyaY protein